MKTILPTLVGIPLLAFFGIFFGMELTDQADAASRSQRGYTSHCYGTPDQCMRGYRPTFLTPRGYLPTQRYVREHDFPRFGSQLWWREQEDRH